MNVKVIFTATKSIAEEVLDSDLAPLYASIAGSIVQRQADSLNVGMVYNLLSSSPTIDEAREAIGVMLPDFSMSDSERSDMGDLLTEAGLQVLDNLPDSAPPEPEGFRQELESYALERVDVMFNYDEFDIDAPPPPNIENPNLPDEAGLDTSYWLALILIAAYNLLGDGATEEEIVSAFYLILSMRIGDKSSGMAWELARMTGYATWLYGSMTGATEKIWVRTTSANPRDIHLAMVGERVPFEGLFSNGDFWTNQLPNCKCSVDLVW